jgi:hypothetical protein
MGLKETEMMDLVFIGATIGFFALCVLYTYACGRL